MNKNSDVVSQIHESREKGNQLYANGDYKAAIASYSQALCSYYSLVGDKPDELSKKLSTSISSPADAVAALSSKLSQAFSSITTTNNSALNSNTSPLSTPASSLESFADANSSQAVIEDSVKPHVLYSNRSAALLHCGKLEEALTDALTCISLQPQ